MKRMITIGLLLFCMIVTAQEIKFGKVSKEELQEAFYAKDSTANAAYLYRKRRTYFSYDKNDGFMIITEIHNRIKIYNKEGFDYATIQIPYYKPESGSSERISKISAYTFNLEGGKVKKEKIGKKQIFNEKLSRFRSVKKMTMPNVKEGSVIDVKYRRTYPYWRIADLIFQFDIPVKRLAYKVEIPEYFIFDKRNRGYYIPKLVETKKNGKIDFGYNNVLNFSTNVYSINAEDVPSLSKREPYVASLNNYRGAMDFELAATQMPQSTYKNYSKTWEGVSKSINQSKGFGGELAKTRYYKKDLEAFLSGVSSVPEKIAKVFQFVKSKVKWNNYYGLYSDIGVSKAYKEGSGNIADINLMLTSMLRSAGVDANPVLVSSKSNGVPLFPTTNGFNYVICMVDLPGNKYVLLDATDPYSIPNVLPFRALNWKGRKVTKDGWSSWVNLVPSKHSVENTFIGAKITEDLEVEGKLKSKFTDYTALGYRSRNNILKEDVVTSKIEEKYNVELSDFKITNKKELGKPVAESYSFIGEDLVEEINGKLYVEPLLFLALSSNPFKSETREFPVDYLYPWKDIERVSIEIPEGYSVESLPKSEAFMLPEDMGTFKYIVKAQGKKITVLFNLEINSAVIPPTLYANLKDFYKKMVEKQTEKIVLVKS